jgi:hypothetical protein
VSRWHKSMSRQCKPWTKSESSTIGYMWGSTLRHDANCDTCRANQGTWTQSWCISVTSVHCLRGSPSTSQDTLQETEGNSIPPDCHGLSHQVAKGSHHP